MRVSKTLHRIFQKQMLREKKEIYMYIYIYIYIYNIYIYIYPEIRQKIIDDLRLKEYQYDNNNNMI